MNPEAGRRLTLVRHANAEQDADVRDFERPLSRKGQNEVLEMARRFQERGLIPDLILASAATRTRETAETFAKVLGVPGRLLQADDALYLAEGDYILSAIRAVGPRVTHLMVIGHNPGISAAAISLAPEAITNDLPTCGTLTMTVNCPTWNLIDRRCVRDSERDSPRKFFDFG
ncbi:MAG TPA: histidine phosphatase family protein [Steroidobacteraceae bacterium]|nr:histidine phosphatase family protein [Steroidobacteraceae bacterium]